MGFINIFIGADSCIKVKNGQLTVRENRETFPIEDINCVMIDNLQTYVTTYALN